MKQKSLPLTDNFAGEITYAGSLMQQSRQRGQVNTGIQYSTKVGHGRRGVPFNMTMGAARLRYFLFGVTIGF